MDFFLQNIIPYLLTYKYITLFVVSFLAAFVVPIPSGSILMAASAFAIDGYFNLGLVILISIFGNLLGDNLGYWTARAYGQKIFSHIGFRRILNSKTFNLIGQKFREGPGLIVLASRFEVLSTLSVNLLSGIEKVSYRKYFIHEAIGTIAQVCFYSLVGYIFGYNWQMANTFMGKVFVVLVFVSIILIISYRRKILIFLKRG